MARAFQENAFQMSAFQNGTHITDTNTFTNPRNTFYSDYKFAKQPQGPKKFQPNKPYTSPKRTVKRGR